MIRRKNILRYILSLSLSAVLVSGADDPLEGAWKIVSIEINAAAVPGMEGAQLRFAGGKKTFALPDGRTEAGTYRLDILKNPKEIDSTTVGKDGTEKGIFAVDGDVLKLCLATGNSSRPREFAAPKDSGAMLLTLKRAQAAAAPEPKSVPAPSGLRTFRMGFTGFVPDNTREAAVAARQFCRDNGDILCHHIEGVPWAESLSGAPYPKSMLDEWEGKKSASSPGGKIYVAISPGRGELKLADKALPLPAELAGRRYDDPAVKKAYLAYCRRTIDFFKPHYLAIGIEVNEIYNSGPDTWNAYAELHKYIYAELKKQHPSLPIFATFTLHNLYKQKGAMLAAWQKLMPFNDLIAVSYYPFFMPDPDRLAALDWLTETFDVFKKTYAIAETNDAAERLVFPKSKITIEGSPQKQFLYYAALLNLAQRRRFEFVISFIHQDYDLLWEKIKDASPELFIAWRDCGFLDENGKPRLARDLWKNYFDLPIK